MSTNPTPQSAQQLLDQANRLQKTVAGFSISWVGFVGICAGGAFYSIAASAWKTAGFNHSLLLIAALTWIFVFVVFTAVVAFRAGAAPRGFKVRWVTMMAVWVLLWVTTTFLAPGFSAVQATGMAAAFLLIAMIGPAWELLSIGRRVQ